MSWLSRLFTGSEMEHARLGAEESRERAEAEARKFERWSAALRVEDRTTKAAAHVQLRSATSATEKGDLPGWLEARESFELAHGTYCKGRAALALAHPKEAASLLLADAAEAAAEIRDPEDRSAKCAGVAELQAHCGDVAGARLTLEKVDEPADRPGVERALAIARASGEALDPFELARELAASDADDWNHEEILLAVAQDRGQRGDVDGARAMLAPIEEQDLKARGARFLAALEAHRGNLAEAQALANGIEHEHWSAATWSDIAMAQAASGDIEGGLKTAESIQDESSRSVALGALAGALEEKGNRAGAEELVNRIEDPQLHDDALTWIAEARAGRGDFAGALATIEGIQDKMIQARELVTLAEAVQSKGQHELAAELLQRALEAADELRSATRLSPAWLAQFLVDARARLGEFEAAEAIVQLLGEERQRAELLAGLAYHAVQRRSAGLVAVEELLDRHQGVLERHAILQGGAGGLLSLANAAASPRP